MREIVQAVNTWLMGCGLSSEHPTSTPGSATEKAPAGTVPIGIAVLTHIEGSAVRLPGAVMAFTAAGDLCGSVSGGCIESLVLQTGKEALSRGQGRYMEFCAFAAKKDTDSGDNNENFEDDLENELFGAVSPCGGTLRVVTAPLNIEVFKKAANFHYTGGKWAIISKTREQYQEPLIGAQFALCPRSGPAGRFEDLCSKQTLDQVQTEHSPMELIWKRIEETTSTGEIEIDGLTLFIAVVDPVPRIFIIGGAHLGLETASLLRAIGYRPIIVDPRKHFLPEARFSRGMEVFQGWPARVLPSLHIDAACGVAALSHDPKIDDQALALALQHNCFYVGALGSRKNHHNRLGRLRKYGITSEQAHRILAPIGLDISAKTPEEIALAVSAEIVSAYRCADYRCADYRCADYRCADFTSPGAACEGREVF